MGHLPTPVCGGRGPFKTEDFEVDRYDLPRSKFGSAGGHDSDTVDGESLAKKNPRQLNQPWNVQIFCGNMF